MSEPTKDTPTTTEQHAQPSELPKAEVPHAEHPVELPPGEPTKDTPITTELPTQPIVLPKAEVPHAEHPVVEPTKDTTTPEHHPADQAATHGNEDHTQGAKIEEVKPDENPDDNPPPLEKVEQQQKSQKGKQSKSEKKSRKAVQKLGMRAVPGVTHVTIKRGTDVFVISEPDVFKSPGDKSNTWVVFGVANTKNLGTTAATRAAEQFKAEETPKEEGAPATTTEPTVETKEEVPAVKVEEVKEVAPTPIEPSQVDLVMDQIACTREEAIKALQESKGNLVDAIMKLQLK